MITIKETFSSWLWFALSEMTSCTLMLTWKRPFLLKKVNWALDITSKSSWLKFFSKLGGRTTEAMALVWSLSKSICYIKTTGEHVQTIKKPSALHNWAHILIQKYLDMGLEPINTKMTCVYVRVDAINKIFKGWGGFPLFQHEISLPLQKDIK